jgi:AcrR family transcriptional regulator
MILEKAHDYIDRLCCENATPKERILAVASDLFYREGIHAVGVDVIAAAANTNKMTLYRHFGSKDELIAAYLRRLAEEGLNKWEDIAAKHHGDPLGQLVEWIEQIGPCKDLNMFSRGCAFINAAAELPDKEHPGRKVIEEYKRKYYDLVLGLCRNAGLREPQKLADELHLVFEGAVVSAQNLGFEGPAARFVELSKLIVKAHVKTDVV